MVMSPLPFAVCADLREPRLAHVFDTEDREDVRLIALLDVVRREPDEVDALFGKRPLEPCV